jgi:hypothetical protein
MRLGTTSYFWTAALITLLSLVAFSFCRIGAKKATNLRALQHAAAGKAARYPRLPS